MAIPQKDLNEFKRIYQKEYGENLTDKEAQRIASNLISLFEIICQPLPRKNDYNKDELPTGNRKANRSFD